ncbi:hypothetical protein [Salicola sp. Rm-C-2C1-2]|uniref:hypothetical protein n=1 Tax=Salicola sp. Rm-C-2C1-2 TaxID=3141321 RepID=UPI0032E4BC0B
MNAKPPRPRFCELCGREVDELTQHHLVPRRLHRKKRFRKAFSREELVTRICWVCRPCHNMIHHVCSEQQLGMFYNTRESLLAIPELADFINWLSTKPPGFVPKKRHPRR